MMSLNKLIDKFSKENTNLVLSHKTLKTPIGEIVAVADNSYLYMVAFTDSKNLEKNFHTLHKTFNCGFVDNGNNHILTKFEQELSAYLNGTLLTFTVPIKMWGSDFQKEVWKKLQQVSYGSTRTYGDLAAQMGRPGSHARAVGSACGANAHLIVIPCHRVVASGSKGGFSCGLDRKEWLLNHEEKFKS